MGSLLQLHFIFLIAFLLISPAISHNCSSSPALISGNTHFADCTDLPSLKSSLHWTYNPTNSTLSIAFTAPLPSSNGWISWGINPTHPGMIGTESLIAFKAPNGSMIVNTYNLTSYKSITQSDKLSFKVLDSKAEYSNGVMQILATLALPSNMTTVNQVWQIGPMVKDGTPVAHMFDPDNLKSKGTLNLATSSSGDGKNATAPAPAGGRGQSSRIWSNNTIFYVFFMFIGVLFL
ncbi:cytochrome b561 and DOMON domain-containing protein At4g12980-like [Solanum dulcamara]|uniref:cytochrome b561 and DOMON domain-containing protein At4g12980-like n=1 Tax=Solanum dulcamara TaxID=45834 RepID=UPI0024869A3F|nr:cytochrome b561 and DOMON domain-containing protein At4g12980-like [Solanum dulcamara]